MSRENTISKENEGEYRHKCLIGQVNFWSMSALGVWSIESSGAAVPLLDSHSNLRTATGDCKTKTCMGWDRQRAKQESWKRLEMIEWGLRAECVLKHNGVFAGLSAFCNRCFVCAHLWGLLPTAFCTDFLSMGTRNQSWTKGWWKFLNQQSISAAAGV